MGFWKKVAGAFVEFDESGAPTGTDGDAAALRAEADRLLAELQQVPPPGGHSARASAADRGSATTAPTAARPPARKDQGPPPLPKGAGAKPPGGAATAVTAVPFDASLPLSTLYSEYGVPPSPYTAEQLLAVLDRLRAMPRDQILVAVEAMDEADDRWNVADVLLDAERKQAALQGVLDRLDADERRAEEEAAQKKERLQAQVAEAEAEVKRQIETLHAQLEDLRRSANEEIRGSDDGLAERRQGYETERQRFSEELKRLRFVGTFFQRTAPGPG